MAAKRIDYSKRYEELMRDAPKRMRRLNRSALQRERAYRREEKRRANNLDSQRALGEAQRRISAEIRKLQSKLNREADQEERILLKAEIAKLRQMAQRFKQSNRRRKPPETGLAVPVEPPKGPLPKQGGAAAPLDFET